MPLLDMGNFPVDTGDGDVQMFGANSNTVGANWAVWQKPRGKTMLTLFGVGAGGGGGEGVAGAASTAAGGGGGSSGGQCRVTIPLCMLPDTLFVSVARGNGSNTSTSAAASFASYVAIKHVQGAPAANAVVFQVNGGASGGKSAGATPGPVGTAAAISTAAQMPLGWGFGALSVAGQVGIIGSNTAGAALALPVTGLMVTGGTGGAGVPAANTAGNAGGAITGVANSQVNATIPGGAAGTTAPTAGGAGQSGCRPFPGLLYGVGGTGGGSCGLTAVPAGAAGGDGGAGAPGCGGGGGGGAFTGSAFGLGGRGGDSFICFVCW